MTEQRYRVIERLASGGMAEVFLGEATSVQGFKKRVAIKRVLPHLASNENFIGMFLDEARLGARLSHANIVSVFDIGSANDTYFIVMDFIDGCDLKKIVETMDVRGESFPLGPAIYIAMEVCRGLSYAHELRDEEGKPLELVHRDMSPPNILISKRGEVKVTDFGLAKARTQLEKTDPGVVKGKFSYLSPETVTGDPVDGRADVFALGVCIWEMLSKKRLFLGETDYETVQLVSLAEIPSLIGEHPEVDEEFEAMLHRALAKDPDDRYATAHEFGDALASYLFRHRLKVTSYDVAAIVKAALQTRSSFPPQIGAIDQMIMEEMSRFTSIEQSSDGTQFDPIAFSLNPDQSSGSRPLLATDFENPAEWFRRDEDVGTAIDDLREGVVSEDTLDWLENEELGDRDLSPNESAELSGSGPLSGAHSDYIRPPAPSGSGPGNPPAPPAPKAVHAKQNRSSPWLIAGIVALIAAIGILAYSLLS